jgi:vancomycin resistance protein YoaR
MNRHLNLAVSGAIIAVVLVLPLLLFAVARALGSDEIAPNVNVAGVQVGGMSEPDALATLQAHEQALQETPAPVIVKGREFSLIPVLIELDVDEQAALATAMTARRDGGFLDQFAEWIRSFRTPVSIPMPAAIDDASLDAILSQWETAAIGLPAEEGGIAVVDGEVVAAYPREGEGIDRPASTALITEQVQTLERPPVTLPTVELIPQVTNADVDLAVAQAQILVDGPVLLTADDPELEITIPTSVLLEAIQSTVVMQSTATIELAFDEDVLGDFLEQYRSDIERGAVDAEFVLSGGTVVIEPSKPETLLDPGLVATTVRSVAAGPDRGPFPFRFGGEAAFTTEDARAMGPIVQESTFTTEHPAGQPRVTNIHLMADAVDGAVIWPGETFSLNEHVGQRTTEKGYVPAPMILRGELVDDVGGGVSQFATTFYNAVFFGCYEDVEHTPHSYYFSRYPEGREATISWTVPDLKFRNDTDAVVVVDTSYTSSSITVSFLGNNGGRECEAQKSDRFSPTEPEEQYVGDSAVDPGSEIIDQNGWGGFSVTITRIMTMPDGEVLEQEWTHRYQAAPRIIRLHPCEIPGAGGECPLPVPSVLGQTWDGALATLADIGFTIADGGTVEVTDESQDGLVQSQTPGPGTFHTPGAAVSVVVGVYVPPPTTTAPPTTTTTVPPDDGG